MPRPRPPSVDHPTDRLTGDSDEIRKLRAQIRHLATFDILGNPHVPTLLIRGETGTGKGLIARIVHDSGPRAAGAFINVNCGALPEALLEAELFGFEAGAFTDAKRAKPGLFEAASAGTLFLDEIEALPLPLQSKLLIAVEDKRVRRLGAVVDRQVDVKLIVATQVDLLACADDGRFRADLYHRLAVVVLAVPPLRARGDDVVMLAEHFLQRYAEAHHLRPKRLSTTAEVWLRNARWRGNVRELGHLAERVTLLCADEVLEPDTLAQWCTSGTMPTPWLQPAPPNTHHERLDEPIRIRQAMLRTGGNVTRAAQLLGLSRKALRYRLSRYGIERPDAIGSSQALTPARPPSIPGEEDHPALPAIAGGGARPRVQTPGEAADGASERPRSGWEQRTVAVLAIDLTLPRTSESAATPPEPWAALHQWEKTLAAQIEAFGGVFLRRSPPLLVAGFGLPRALEQMPHRAVQAAAAIRRVVEEAQRATGGESGLEVRQAAHLGPVLVDTGAPDPIMRLPAVGDTLALPMRLLGHAAPGEILLSGQAARLVEGAFELRARELPLHTGKPDPVLTYAVAGLRSRQPAGGAVVHTRSPFVGRERELALLRDVLAQVEGGQGQVVGVVSEPGMGKSRLLGEFRRQLTRSDALYVEGRCFAYSQAIPYWPLLDILRQHCGIAEVDPPEAVAEKVHWRLQSVGMEPDAGAPFLLGMLGTNQGTEQVADLTPQTMKARTFETLTQLNFRANQGQSLVLAVEDIHWIDDTSAEYVASLVERLAGVPIMLLCTYRPGYQPDWMHKSYATRLTLTALSPRDSLHIVRAVLQQEQVPDTLAHAILAKAEGNPFFLEELAQTVTQQGEMGVSVALPETIQGAIMARIDALADAPRRLLQTMAVVGRACPAVLLMHIAEQPTDTLRRTLSVLQGGEFLYEQPAMPEPKYVLKHALTQEVAYHSLARERRMELHERIAWAIESLFRDRLEEHYGELAQHYRYSGNTAQAVVYLEKAARRALQQSAHGEAISHLTTAMELLKTLPDSPERAEQELALQTALGPALIVTKGHAAPDVERTYARARELCAQVGETPQLFPVLRGLFIFYMNRAELQTAYTLAAQRLSLAERRQDQALTLAAHDSLGGSLYHLGSFAPARKHLAHGLALYHRQPPPPQVVRGVMTDHGVSCLSHAAWVLWCMGHPDQALARSREAVALAREVAQPFSLVQALYWSAQFHQFRRDRALTQERAEAAIQLSTAQGFAQQQAQGTFLRGWALAMRGCVGEGLAQMHQGLAAWEATGAKVLRPYYLGLQAEVHAQVGQIDAGLCVLQEALTAMQATGERSYEAELYRLQGTLLLALAADSRAEACFRQALDTARRQGAKSLELRAAVSLGRLWQRQGKCAEARELLAAVYGWFTEGFDTADLQEATTLLDALS